MCLFFFHPSFIRIIINRGGSISWAIREITKNNSLTQNGILVRVTQRHSWRRSFGNAHFCNASTIASSGLIGEGELVSSTQNQPAISATVQCTDFDEQFDYSSGEISTSITVPMNKRIEYLYQGCCWITLLPPDQGSGNSNNIPFINNIGKQKVVLSSFNFFYVCIEITLNS